MPAGLEVRNDGGFIVIDGEYKNQALKAKGTATTTSLVGAFSNVQVTISGITGTPIVVVNSATGAIAIIRGVNNGNVTFEVFALGPVGTQVAYYVFADPVAASNYLEIRNAADQVVFNGAEKYLKVVGTLDYRAYASGEPSWTGVNSRTYAWFITRPAARSVIYNDGNNGSNTRWFTTSVRGIPRVNNGVISVVAGDAQTTGPQIQATRPNNDYDITARAVIVDVTTY